MVAFALYLLYSHFNTAQSAVKYNHAAFLLINYQTLLTYLKQLARVFLTFYLKSRCTLHLRNGLV